MYSVFLFHPGISFAVAQCRIAQEKVWWVHDSCRIPVQSTGACKMCPAMDQGPGRQIFKRETHAIRQ